MPREGFSVWRSSDTMFHGAALGRTDARGKYKGDEESSHRVFDEANSRAERREAPRCMVDINDNSRAERVELSRRAYDDVNDNEVASKRSVALTTAITEDGLRDNTHGRETWAIAVRGGYGPPCNDPLCMQGNPNGALMEEGCRCGESSRARLVVGCEPRNDTAPRICGEYDMLIESTDPRHAGMQMPYVVHRWRVLRLGWHSFSLIVSTDGTPSLNYKQTSLECHLCFVCIYSSFHI